MRQRRPLVVWALVASATVACSDDTTPSPMAPNVRDVSGNVATTTDTLRMLRDSVRLLAAARNIGPLGNPAPVRPSLVLLGQMLLFDPILSGNRDIACMTCHHPKFATSDARHLSIGQGATGLGPSRVHPTGAFIPRNSPALFNVHTTSALFWDGRVSVDSTGAFSTPAGAALTPAMTQVFEFGAASALGLFPVTSREEMRAFQGNELATIADTDFQGIWSALMQRLGSNKAYRLLFQAAYPGTRFDRMTFAHASNAMAGFMVGKLAFNRTPWDRFLRGDDRAMTARQLRGAQFFLTQNCSICHGGNALSGGAFANVAVRQLGPGQGDGPSGHDDFGRERVTGLAADRYKFRTPALRNVELTAPYGHAGQFVQLRDFIDHYSQSDVKLATYNAAQLEPLLQGTVLGNVTEILSTRSGLLNNFVMTSTQVDQLTDFMHALTDPRARFLNLLRPNKVPSGLPVP
jgi:cytochrome c peroxidase